MKRTVLLLVIFVVGTLISDWVNLSEAQQAGKVYRVGYLRFRCSSLTTNAPYIAFRQGLREIGYIEGQNLVIEYRSTEGKRERRPR